ncbi:MAG: NAD(P)H-dependent oxidoreductase [Patescibacteria group bacterium]
MTALFAPKLKPKEILVIQGSLSQYSKSHILVESVAQKLRDRDCSFGVLDIRLSDIDFYKGAGIETYGTPTREAYARIAAAHAFVFSSPVYGGKISGGIRNLIDVMKDAMKGKLAAVMCSAKEGNAYPASVELKELLTSAACVRTVQPIVLVSDESFKNNLIYDDVVHDVMEEMLYSLTKQCKEQPTQNIATT